MNANLKDAPYYIPAHDWETVESLPAGWRWQSGWRFAKRLGLSNATSLARDPEPIEVRVEFADGQIDDPSRELRILQVNTDGSGVREVPSQTHSLDDGPHGPIARVLFLASLPADGEITCLLFYGNPGAQPPTYETDLQIDGQQWDLTIDNLHYTAQLAPSMGQLKSLFFKTHPPVSHEAPAALIGEGPPMDGGHGVEGTIHWGPDWSDAHAGRYRITNWDRPPQCDILRGPVCLRVRRSGHGILALGPGVGRDESVRTTVTYSFYAGCPWIEMESVIEVLRDVHFRDCRNEEWVGFIPALPEAAWMARGEIGLGPRSWRGENPAWMTYYNRTRKDGFASIQLDYECSHPNGRQPDIVSMNSSSMRVRTRGGWVRYPLRNTDMRAGDVVRERNAYLVYRFGGQRDQGFGEVTDCRQRLTSPPEQVQRLPAPKPVTVDHVMDALRDCFDHETYIEGDLFGQWLVSVVDLGLVRDVTVDGADVAVHLVMPYPGRETWFGWFADNIEARLRERLEGVGAVDVKLVRDPPWGPDQMNDHARRLLGLNDPGGATS